MHPCLGVDEIVRFLTRELVVSKAKKTAVALACCCKGFEDPVLDVLWETQERFGPLLRCFPARDIWKKGETFVSWLAARIFSATNHQIRQSFKRIPTKAEWTNFRKYALRMRVLELDLSEDVATSNTLLMLQTRTANDPLLPGLKTFHCTNATGEFIPFMPCFLSPTTTEIDIKFDEDTPTVVIGSTITRLPTLCPNLQRILLNFLPRDPVITEAVSEMLLAYNRDTLQWFLVDSPLTEEAREVVYRLPKLTQLWVVLRGRTSLPTMALPNLAVIDVEYEDNPDWLEGFRGARLESLDSASFRSESRQIGDFLGKFANVAETTPALTKISVFTFITSRSWNPSYRSLLSFTRMEELTIGFSCTGGCSSNVDDSVIVDLARAMPNLKILKLGNKPCRTRAGVTIKGLIGLARGCSHLSELRIHFQTGSFNDTAISAQTAPLSDGEAKIRRHDCALTNLEVGDIPIQDGDQLTVTVTLLQIFPRLSNIEPVQERWGDVLEGIKQYKRIGTLIHTTSKAHLFCKSLTFLMNDVLPGGTLNKEGKLES